MGETLKAKLDAKLGRDKDAQIPIEPEVNFDSYADKLLERISRDEILDIHDLLLLPEDHASDLSKRYQNDIKATVSSPPIKMVAKQHRCLIPFPSPGAMAWFGIIFGVSGVFAVLAGYRT